MKIDLDPVKNRMQYEKLRKFSVRNILFLKAWYYYLFGAVFIVFGVLFIFADPESVSTSGDLTQTETGLFFAGIGLGVVVVCKVVNLLNNKIKSYQPKPNQGDEWNN